MNYNAVSYVVKYKDRFEAFNCNGDTLYEYDDCCCCILFEYDEKGRLTHSTMIENGSVYIDQIFKYDDNDNIIYRDFINHYVEFSTYNKNNELLGVVTKYYDGDIDRLIDFKNHGYMVVGSDLSLNVVEYDDSDNVIRERENNRETICSYDENGELISFHLFDARTKEVLQTTYSHKRK